MNILYHHRTQASGAAGQHIREMIKAFKDAGHSVDIVSPPSVDVFSSKKSGSQGKNRYFIPQFLFEFLEIFYNLMAFFRLKNQLKQKRYSFIYERYAIFNIAGIICAKMTKLPIVLEASFTSKNALYPERTKMLSGLACLFDRFIFKRASGIVVVSTVLKDILLKDFNIGAEKILVLPNAVDPGVFDASISGEGVKLKYGLNSNKVVGFVGGFYPWHGLELFLDAAEKTLKQFPETKFMLVGNGPLRGSLERKVKKSLLEGAVIFTGSVPHNELPQYIASFDIGVLPDSNDYGSPIKIFEYMAMGKPVLAPTLQPIEDAIANGINGVLFEAKNSEALSSAIIQLLTDSTLYIKVASKGKEKVLQEYTWNKNAERTLLQLYGEK